MYDKDFYNENKDYIFAFVVVLGICLFALWICHDIFRNEPIYNDTDSTMERIEERINGIEQRVNRMSERLTETQKAVSGISAGIKHSTELADEITSGIGTTESRLDDAVQRSGRIQNLITEFERANRP